MSQPSPASPQLDNVGKRALSGLKWQLVQTFGRQGAAFGVSLVLARLLEPASFGLMSMVNLYIAFITLFVQQGISSALIQRRDVSPHHLSTAFWFGLATAAVACLLTAFLSPAVSRLFDQPALTPLILASSLGLLISAAGGVHEALFLREMDFRRPALRVLLATVLGGSLGIVLALSGFGVWSLVGLHLATSVASTLFLWLASPWRPSFRFSFTHLRELMGLSSSLFSSSLLWFFASRADVFFIGRVLGAADLGLYSLAGRIPELLRNSIAGPIARVALPVLSRLQDSPHARRELVGQTMSAAAILGFPTYLGLAAVAPTAVPVVFGSKWVEAVAPLQALCFFSLTCFLQLLVHPLMVSLALTREYLVVGILNAALVVTACASTVRFGTTWMVIAMVISLNVVGVVSFSAICRRSGLSFWFFLSPCIRPAIAALVMAAVVHAMNQFGVGPVVLAGQVLSGALLYLLIILAIDRSRLQGAYRFLARHRNDPVSSPSSASFASETDPAGMRRIGVD